MDRDLNQQIQQLEKRLAQYERELATKHRDQERLNTLLSLLESLSSELDLDILLKKMVVSAANLLGVEHGAIGLVDEQRHAIRHRALYNLPQELLKVDFREGVGISGQVYATKRPVIVRDYSQEVQIPIADPTMRQIKSALSLPIWWQGRLIGVFSIGTFATQRIFDAHDVEVLSLFAKHAAIAIENARLYGEVEHSAHLKERHRMARELHDSLTQTLFTIVLLADGLRNMLRTGSSDAVPTAESLYQSARDALTDMRALIYELRPASLEGDGLLVALNKMADAVRTRHGLLVQVQAQDVRRIAAEKEVALYRIGQEAVHNVVKHAHAKSVIVDLRMTESEAYMVVTDDGVGFRPVPRQDKCVTSMPRTGLGLESMYERAEQMKGCLIVSSIPRRGTQIQVRIPLSEEAHGTNSSLDRG